MDDDEAVLEGDSAPGPDLLVVENAIAAIRDADKEWVEPETLALEGVAWKPHLARADGSAVLHVHVADRLRPYLVTRMRAAASAGHTVHVALPLDALFDEELMLALGELDALIHVLRPTSSEVDVKPRYHLSAVADEGVPVTAPVRTELAGRAWERRSEGEKHARGRRFEGLVAFLLSQVADFRVKERNFRGETDEVDVVVQVERVSGRCWYESGVPFILVEAKNWKDPVDQKEVSAFITKIKTKRGRCKIGLMVGASGFTSDARTQELKFATEDLVIVFIGPEEMQSWINENDADEYLETLFRHAMLR